jgi:hypothetical protein
MSTIPLADATLDRVPSGGRPVDSAPPANWLEFAEQRVSRTSLNRQLMRQVDFDGTMSNASQSRQEAWLAAPRHFLGAHFPSSNTYIVRRAESDHDPSSGDTADGNFNVVAYQNGLFFLAT